MPHPRPEGLPGGGNAHPLRGPVIGLKFDHIVIDDADSFPQDRLDYAALLSWASTFITVFLQDGGRVRTQNN